MEVCWGADGRWWHSPALPLLVLLGEAFPCSSLFFLQPLLLLTGQVCLYVCRVIFQEECSLIVGPVCHQSFLPMSPFSIARMSGLSLQSVRGIVPSISAHSSFSCMAKEVKLYICKQRKTPFTHIRTGRAGSGGSGGSSQCRLMSGTWAELAGLGFILHSSWLPGTTSTPSAAAAGTSSCPWATHKQNKAALETPKH